MILNILLFKCDSFYNTCFFWWLQYILLTRLMIRMGVIWFPTLFSLPFLNSGVNLFNDIDRNVGCEYNCHSSGQFEPFLVILHGYLIIFYKYTHIHSLMNNTEFYYRTFNRDSRNTSNLYVDNSRISTKGRKFNINPNQ